MAKVKNKLGMIDPGGMRRNLLLNMSDHRFPVIGYDKDGTKIKSFLTESRNLPVDGVETLDSLIGQLAVPVFGINKWLL